MAKLGHKGNGHGHVTETPDVSHVRNVDVTHELSDVNVPGILKFVGALVLMTVVVYVLMYLLFGFFNAQEARKESEAPPGPMAMTEQESLPPEPRLQAAKGFGVKLENGEWVTLEKREPQAEYRVVKKQWDLVLKEGPKDQSGNSAGLPIEQAMQKVLEGQGLPSRPPTPQEMTDFYTPTAASSGRVSEKVKE
ncbi:MAG: hypothetical protein H0U18_04185 [Pyrinomonadaceae bacterium]|jgi:hypothetical protein|nr:hypothetical protein [Pyrinomonadaceae bacterium]